VECLHYFQNSLYFVQASFCNVNWMTPSPCQDEEEEAKPDVDEDLRRLEFAKNISGRRSRRCQNKVEITSFVRAM
jgi:hypothetical protein